MSTGGQTTTQATTNTLDPFVKEALTQNIQAARQVSQIPYQAYSGPRVAGFRPAEQQAFDVAQQAAAGQVGASQLAQATAAAQRAAGYSPAHPPVYGADWQPGAGTHSPPVAEPEPHECLLPGCVTRADYIKNARSQPLAGRGD